MEVLVMIGQVLLALTILVGVHEAGHLLTAKYFGMRVEKFSIGFPPKVYGVKYGETEYSIGAIPLGGFVKISGMIDESMDKDQMAQEPKDYEFRSKPAWQRLIVMLGGIIVNVITAIIIFVCLFFFVGEQYYKWEDINKQGIHVSKLGSMIGLKTGDKILEVNGQQVEKFKDALSPDALLSNNSYYTVLRDGKTIRVDITPEFINEYTSSKEARSFMTPRRTFSVGEVNNRKNKEAGLKEGDVIITVNQKSIQYFDEFHSMLQENKGKLIDAEVLRGTAKVPLQLQVSEKGTIGIGVKYNDDGLTEYYQEYGIGSSITSGTSKAFGVISTQIKAFRKMFSGEINASESLSGPIGIGKIFGGTWDWFRFWSLTGMLSMVLAFMNLLPIPALDGGHVMFLLYEIISGKAPSDKFLEKAQTVGMVILLALMVFIFGNDIFKLIRDMF